MADQPIFVSEEERDERQQYLRSLGVSDKQIRNNRLLADMPGDAWRVLLNELLRERRGKLNRFEKREAGYGTGRAGAEHAAERE